MKTHGSFLGRRDKFGGPGDIIRTPTGLEPLGVETSGRYKATLRNAGGSLGSDDGGKSAAREEKARQ